MKFRKGEEIACIVPKCGWYECATKKPINGPDKHEVVTADGYHRNGTHVFLREYPHVEGWEERCFVPLVSDAVLRQELETVKEPYTI